MRVALIATTIALLSAIPAWAVPADYKDVLPADVLGMTPKQVREEGGRLVVFYGESVGRATLTVSPAPEADPDGAEAMEGDTPSAQRVLMQLVESNLAAGTGALGPGYATAPVQVNSLDVDGRKALCALVERSQAEDSVEEGKEQIFLLDRICAAQNGEDVISVSVTTPITEDMRRKITSDQLGFSGILIKVLSEARAP